MEEQDVSTVKVAGSSPATGIKKVKILFDIVSNYDNVKLNLNGDLAQLVEHLVEAQCVLVQVRRFPYFNWQIH